MSQDSHHKTHRQCSQIAQRDCAQDYIIVTGHKSPSTHDRQLRRWWCWHLRNFNLPVSLNWAWMPVELGFLPNSFFLSGCLFPPLPLPLFFNLHFLLDVDVVSFSNPAGRLSEWGEYLWPVCPLPYFADDLLTTQSQSVREAWGDSGVALGTTCLK